MATSWEKLQEWLEAPEGTNIEFKKAEGRYGFDELIPYCVALANEGGGTIILGATDKRPRKIVGTRAFSEPGRTEAGLYKLLSHRVPVEETHSPDGKRILIVHVPGRLDGVPWTDGKGRCLKREGDDLVGMTGAELAAIYAEVAPDFTAKACDGATMEDLSADAIRVFRERWADKTRDERKRRWSDIETLSHAELTVGGKITYAALILFGTRESLGRFLAQAELVFEYRSSEAAGPAADRENIREGFFLWHNHVWDKINLRNDRQSYQDGLFRMEIPTFDEVSVREALLNAVCHRDYRRQASVFLRQYPHRMEFVSPGGFPTGVTPENVLEQQNPRNRRLAEALERCGLVERSGQGMDLMFEKAIRQGKQLPSFEGTSDHEVKLTLDGTVVSPEFVRYMEQLGDKTLQHFSTHDFLVLDLLRREKALPDHLKERLPGLVKAGAVESIGRGRGTRYLLSRGLYAALGSKGDYTRTKGLDRGHNKQLLLNHITENAATGAQMKEFRQVLPSFKTSQIQVLLRELVGDGKIHVVGKGRGARWYPDEANCNPEESSR